MSDHKPSHLFKQYYSFLNSTVKANQLSMAITEAFVYFHLYVLESNVNLLMPQVKEAVAVSDPQTWRALLVHQTKTLSDLYSKSMEDNKLLSDLAMRLKSKFDSLIQENLRLFSTQNLWQYKNLLNPVFATDTLYNAMLEACMDLHLRALEAHTRMMLAPQTGETTAVNNAQSWQAFLLHQDEAISKVYQNFLGELKTLSDLMTHLQAEFDKLIEESTQFANP